MSDLVRDVINAMTPKANVRTKKDVEFKTGDTVGVYVRIREGDKDRIQLYKGVVIKIQGTGPTRSFTVRKISAGVGVERTFPINSPAIDRIELVARGKVRRSRLYYLRALKGKAARLVSELVGLKDDAAAAAPAPEAEAQAEAKAE